MNIRQEFSKAKSQQKAKAEREWKERYEGKERDEQYKSEAEILDEIAFAAVTDYMQQEIGERLRSIRKKQNKTQAAIVDNYSNCQSISTSTLSRWEQGRRAQDIVFLAWFSQKYDVDLNWLITGEIQSLQDETVQKIKEWYKQGEDFFHKL